MSFREYFGNWNMSIFKMKWSWRKFFTRLASLASLGWGIGLTMYGIFDNHVPEFLFVPIIGLFGIFGGTQFWLDKQRTKEEEIRILRIINECNGKATFGEIVLKTDISIDRVKKHTEKLQNLGALGTVVNENGEIIYCLTTGSFYLNDIAAGSY